MKCYDVRSRLSALLDGAAEAGLRDDVARHVAGCAACRAELEAVAGADRTLARALRLAAAGGPPEKYFETFWSRLDARLSEEDGSVSEKKEEVSGLHDIRALAASTIERHAEKAETDSLLTSSSSALR